jgi:hypothetical protein
MKCKEIQVNAWDYVEGKLAPDLLKEFENHLLSCESCQHQIIRLKDVDKLINGSKELAPDPYSATRIMGHIESTLAENERVRFLKPVYFLRPVLITAAILVGFLAGKYMSAGRQHASSIVIANNQEIQTLRSELFISDLLDEEKSIIPNP